MTPYSQLKEKKTLLCIIVWVWKTLVWEIIFDIKYLFLGESLKM